MSWLSSLFRRPLVIAPVAVRAGDDLVVSLRDRLDSDDAFALLDALKQQFPATTIHLLTGFGDVQVQRHDGGSNGTGGDDRRDPPLPVGGPAPGKPASRMAAAREKGDVVVITCATQFRLIAVYIPPKQQSDSVPQTHVSPLKA